jgi:outer membrane protein OmpA-like peptidoglycan-associated protein
MNPLETYQSDAVERPLLRRRLFWALFVSLLLHGGIVWWFHQTHLPEFSSAPVERLVPRQIFNLKNITIDEKILDGSEDQHDAPKMATPAPAIKPLDLPDEKPMAEVSEGRMSPGAPATADIVKPIASEKPMAESSEAQAIARVQDSAKMVMEQDLNSLKASLLKDQPASVAHSLIKLPETNPGDSATTDAQELSVASGALDKLLGHGLHAGDAPVMLPGGAMFEFDSSALRTESLDQLHKLGVLIQKNPAVTFSIEGYTDSFGDAAYNIALSQARADAVRAWLIQNMDVDPTHIQAAGYGATRFIVPPQPVDMHSQASIEHEKALEQPNRRVEIRFKFPNPQ